MFLSLQRSQAAGSGAIGRGFATSFGDGRLTRTAFTFGFFALLLFRFMSLLCQIFGDASKTSL
jgi:hypothetical protein